ncbi:ribulose-phosphate 3-epimerase [Corynebacterium choanae]|uniref:Ribulose-phosphate 3-epimerase n=1 Tax=Corynebacterium choanae TaxID=1862358 RepID=A0A3G6J6R2_9CORY|nr:ribulose-phosphate 3-epimerase [Corynebacterium choanae]AZA13646.1 Ribulose-phosphate 3-epimerase [Corynebacterium choanae]
MAAPIIAPSILAADFAYLARDIAAVDNADWIHVDIMDGHFVPNLSFGPDITAAAHRVTDLPLDVHLMIENPGKWVDQYVDAGARTVIIHQEAASDWRAICKHLRSSGVNAGVAIKPGTSVSTIIDHLAEIDEVLIMSVEPGFGGQSFMPEVLDKVVALRQRIDEENHPTVINIDGGINQDTIAQAAAAGVDAFVAGSAVFRAADPASEVEQLRRLAAAGNPRLQ